MSQKEDYPVLITVSVFLNYVLISQLMKWLVVEVAMTQTAMILMWTEFKIILNEKVCNRHGTYLSIFLQCFEFKTNV